jgi:hypothetical protein
MASEAKVTKHYLEWGTQKYFRGKAENVELCSYGEKKDPIGANAYLAVQAKVQREHLAGKIQEVPPLTVDWNSASKADVEVNGEVQYFVLNAKTAKSASYEKVKSGHLELVKFFINEGPLQRMLNKEADGARKYLAEEGADGRIVSEIWVAMEAEMAEHFRNAASTTSAASGALGPVQAALEITASGGTQGSQTISLSPGTTFAYLMHKVNKWNKDKTQIEGLEDDRKGMG